MDERVYLIWLSLACTPGSKTFAKLVLKYNTPKEIYGLEEDELKAVVGSRESDYARLLDKNLERATAINEFCTSKKVGILSYFDDEFPENLRTIPNPPVLLYYRGVLPDFKRGFRLAVVGTRSLSDYGRINAFHLGYDMGCAGATIVSGLAKGIDGVAHAGALAAGAVNIAFLGCGIDVCYPSEHLTLAKEIVKTGCIFTEFPPGSRPDGHHFPVRNRLISGISNALVVVEAPERSGAIITATCAKEQGRPVFAFPGNVNNDGSQATNLLIKNGAMLCSAADDIILKYENIPCTGLNPFKLPTKRTVNMLNVLTEYRVSATTYSDIYHLNACERRANKSAESRVEPRRRSNAKVTETSDEPPVKEPVANETVVLAEEAEEEIKPHIVAIDRGTYTQILPIDAEAIKIYKMIPLDGACSISDLIVDGADSSRIMSALLKLEMSSFVTLLPGDRVIRKMK